LSKNGVKLPKWVIENGKQKMENKNRMIIEKWNNEKN
jgi:hypothetical protein